eukprot:scaffold24716_cov129-Isochrysis_galbana.AAC.2
MNTQKPGGTVFFLYEFKKKRVARRPAPCPGEADTGKHPATGPVGRSAARRAGQSKDDRQGGRDGSSHPAGGGGPEAARPGGGCRRDRPERPAALGAHVHGSADRAARRGAGHGGRVGPARLPHVCRPERRCLRLPPQLHARAPTLRRGRPAAALHLGRRGRGRAQISPRGLAGRAA